MHCVVNLPAGQCERRFCDVGGSDRTGRLSSYEDIRLVSWNV